MDIVFLGSSKFAVPTLKHIISSSYRIICVVTRPDRMRGRGLSLSSTEVKKAAEAHGLQIYQPEDVNREECVGFLKGLKPDIFIVVSFGQILNQDILSIPRILCLNLHASLLPKYRGAAPVNWALIRGETETGVSVIKMSKRLDAGPIIMQRKTEINDNDDAQSLSDRLSVLGAEVMLESLRLIQINRYELVLQDESEATLAPKLKKEDGLIEWDKPARDIFNLIRGCAGWPGTFTYYKDKILKIHKARISYSFASVASRTDYSPGEILEASSQGLIVGAGSDYLLIEELQMEGKKRVSAAEFISGYKISVGEKLGMKK